MRRRVSILLALMWSVLTARAQVPHSSPSLTPGSHKLVASALHPSGLFTTNVSIWVTNTAANETVTDSFDAAGRLTQRVWRSPTGATNQTQTLIWDLKDRLWQVLGSDSHGNGFGWIATY